MNDRKLNIHLFIIIGLLMAGVIWLYAANKYLLFAEAVSKVEITVNSNVQPKAIPILYLASENASKINFQKVYRPQKVSDSVYIYDLSDVPRLRFFRLYFDYPDHSLNLYGLKVSSKTDIRHVDLSNIETNGRLQIKEHDNIGYSVNIKEASGYIQMSRRMAYTEDFKHTYPYLLCLIAIWIVAFFVAKSLEIPSLNKDVASSWGLSVLILSIFCPAPIYNVALILAVILNLKNLRKLKIKKQKLSLLLILFFLIYVLNNLLISEDGFTDLSTIDRFLPFLFLSVVVPVMNNKKFLVFFPVSALVLGFGFLITSIIDMLINKNEVYLSFDFFTKYLHPIYYSYLLFFSICYVYLNIKGGKKYFLIGTLFVFMIFSGSKMVLVFTILAMFINIVRINNTGLLAIPLLLILLIFTPLKQRFNDVLSIDDLSILKEQYIENPNDDRINGLTLRLVLWREALATMNGLDYLIGKGVTDRAEDELTDRLDNLGLTEHVQYNPHNQYVDTFWRTGLIGLISLLLIPLFAIFKGLKKGETLLIQFALFMLAAMFSESIFGRVNGIYFFVIILLMLTSSNLKPTNEDSYIRN